MNAVWRYPVFLAVLAASMAGAAPSLEVTPTVYDFGKGKQSEAGGKFTFVLKNVGDELLVIQNIRPFCGCTTVEPTSKELQPGEHVELKGSLRTSNYEGFMSKAIAITTNDPQTPTKMLRVQIRLPFLQPGLRLYPKYNISGFPARIYKEQMRAYLWVQNCDEKGSQQVTRVEVPDGWTLKLQLPAEIKPAERVRIEFWRDLAEGETPAEFDGLPFAVHTTHPDYPKLEGKIKYRIYKPRPTPAPAAETPETPATETPKPGAPAPAPVVP